MDNPPSDRAYEDGQKIEYQIMVMIVHSVDTKCRRGSRQVESIEKIQEKVP
jgi:hypothetical protein